MPLKKHTHPRLSIDQFFSELERVRDMFDWHFQPDTRPGTERRRWPRFWIWAKPKDAKGLRLDPVEAVCYAICQTHAHWREAGPKIGLSPTDAEALNAAATDRTWREGADGRRRPDEHLHHLRTTILETIGNDRFILDRPVSHLNLNKQ